jgi:hypothetical protein
MKKHRLAYFLGMILLTVLYMIGTDPDAGLISNLPFGADVIMVTEKFLLGLLIIMFVEIVPDYLTDKETGTVEELMRDVKGDAFASGLVILARAIKVAAYVTAIAMLF